MTGESSVLRIEGSTALQPQDREPSPMSQKPISELRPARSRSQKRSTSELPRRRADAPCPAFEQGSIDGDAWGLMPLLESWRDCCTAEVVRPVPIRDLSICSKKPNPRKEAGL